MSSVRQNRGTRLHKYHLDISRLSLVCVLSSHSRFSTPSLSLTDMHDTPRSRVATTVTNNATQEARHGCGTGHIVTRRDSASAIFCSPLSARLACLRPIPPVRCRPRTHRRGNVASTSSRFVNVVTTHVHVYLALGVSPGRAPRFGCLRRAYAMNDIYH